MRKIPKYILAVLLFFSALASILLWVLGDLPDLDQETNHALRLGSTVIVLLCVAVILWAATRRDKAPDFLRRLFGDSFERDGFCFVVTPNLAGDVFVLNVYYQNRYARLCHARVVLMRRTMPPSKRVPWSMDIDCEGGAFGVARIPWSVPAPFQGASHKLVLYATVNYPQGRGKMLRFKEGGSVGAPPAKPFSFRYIMGKAVFGVFALGGLIIGSTPATVTLNVPSGVAEWPPGQKHASAVTFWRPGDEEEIDLTLPPLG